MNLKWKIHPITADDCVQSDWDSLRGIGSQLPIQDFDFWSVLLQTFGFGDELVCICRDDSEIVASTIVRHLGKGRWETVAPAQAPLGAWVSKESLSITRLLDSLANVLPGYVLSVGVTRLDPSILERPDMTRKLSTMDYITTGQIWCDDGFDSYWKKRGKNLRHNMNRQRNHLERESIKTRLRAVSAVDLIGECVDAYGILESSGWKSKSGTALHPDNAQGQFYRALFEHYCKSGEAIVYEYYYDSDHVATDLCLRRENKVVILKTTHDENQKKTSPALLMRQESIRTMVDTDGVRNIEFYGKKMDWHTKWTDEFRVMYHINYDRWKVLTWLRKLMG